MPRMPFGKNYLTMNVPQIAGTRWTLPGWVFANRAGFAVASGWKAHIPIFVCRNWTYVGIGCEVSALAAGSARLGIYAVDGSGLPAALILDAGTVDTGSIGDKTIVISQLLRQGYYYLAIVFNAAPSLYGPNDGNGVTIPASSFAASPGSIYGPVLFMTGVAAEVAGGLSNPASLAGASMSAAGYASVNLQEA